MSEADGMEPRKKHPPATLPELTEQVRSIYSSMQEHSGGADNSGVEGVRGGVAKVALGGSHGCKCGGGLMCRECTYSGEESTI